MLFSHVQNTDINSILENGEFFYKKVGIQEMLVIVEPLFRLGAKLSRYIFVSGTYPVPIYGPYLLLVRCIVRNTPDESTSNFANEFA